MNYLSVEKLTKSFGDLVLFENISFGIDKGQKVALVAENGSGKSTLFNILTAKDTPDSGKIVFNQEAKTAFLEQSPRLGEGLSVLEAVFNSEQESIRAVKRYEAALLNPSDEKELQGATEQMDLLEAWDYDQKIREILTRFNILDLHQKTDELSGGQQKRIALAKVIIEAPDFIFLDEPTNHLDIEMIEWLEEYLIKQNISIFMITHDRYFLEKICNEIIELEDQRLYHYKGNYSYFLEKKTEREENQNADVLKARNLLRTELDWMRRMPQARGTKSKDRIDRFYKLEDQARKNLKQKELKLGVKVRRMGGKILELHQLSKSFDQVRIIENFSYKFQKNEKLGIVGPNGVGKTSFINLLTDQLKPDQGEVVKGETIVFGYYRQEEVRFNPGKKVIEVVTDIAEFIPIMDGTMLSASQMLERFLFPTAMQYKQVAKLSGGEQRRLYLLTVLMKNPNFLILDEPTNDLDILTLNVLEEFLLYFQGCLLLVSHDRYFMDKLVDHIFIFEGNGVIRDYNGKYSEYRLANEREKKTKGKQDLGNKAEKRTKTKPEKTKLSYKEKLEFEQLESDIEELEERKAVIESIMSSGEESDHETLQKLAEELSSIIGLLEEKENRWLELSEYA